MNIAMLMPSGSIDSTLDRRRLATASQSNNLDRDLLTFDDSSMQRKRHLILRRLPRDGLIRRLVANPPKIVKEEAVSALMEEVLNSGARNRLPLAASYLHIESANSRSHYCSLSQTKTDFYFGRSQAQRSFLRTSQRVNTETTTRGREISRNKSKKAKVSKIETTEFDRLARVTTLTLGERSMTSRPRKSRRERTIMGNQIASCKCTQSPQEGLQTKMETLANTVLSTPTSYTSRIRPYFKKPQTAVHRGASRLHDKHGPDEIRGWDTIQ